MMWVNEILPPRARLRLLFITSRLSATNFAGMSRTLVAVGTVRLASMFATVRAAAPFSATISSRLTRPLFAWLGSVVGGLPGAGDVAVACGAAAEGGGAGRAG